MTLTPTTAQATNQLREFVDAIFEPNDVVEVRALHDDKPTVQKWLAASDLPRLASGLGELNKAGFNIYVGANPRKAPGGSHNADVACARTFFVDFDGLTLEEVRRRIDEAALPTLSMIVNSGHGFHCYWLLDEPLIDLDLWSRYQQALINELGSDPCIKDAARIMRLPGFLNVKGDPVVCDIIDCDPARQYPLDEFPRSAPRPTRTAPPNGKVDTRERENATQYLARLKPERADEYADWLSVGMVLHTIDPSDSMLAEWDRWSRQSKKWEDGACSDKWGTFHANGSLGIASLHQWANEDSAGQQRKNPQSGNRVSESQPFAPFVPLDQADVPAMPDNLMPGWFGCMSRAVAAATETSVAMPAMIGMAVLGLACQRRFGVSVRAGHVEPTNIWTATPAESGERKTGVFKPMILPVIKYEMWQRDDLEPLIKAAESKRATVEQRIKHLRKQAAKAKSGDVDKIHAEITELEADLPDLPKVPQLFAQDTTTEHLGTMMADNDERMALLSDEGGMFDNIAGRYARGVPNLDLILQAHDGTPIRVDRGSRPSVRLNHPLLTIGILPQPDVIRQAFSKPGFEGRGLMSRFLYWLPRSALGERTHETERVPDHVRGDYYEAINNLLRVPVNEHDEYGIYTLSPIAAASDALRSFVLEIEPMLRESSGRLAGSTALRAWGSKLQGQVYRLAGLFHCIRYAIEGGPERHAIDVAEAETAVRFARLLIPHAIEVFCGLGSDEATELAKRIWAWLLRNERQSFRERDAFIACKTRKSNRMDEFTPAFDLLCAHGYLADERPKPGLRGGCPSVIYHVNPTAVEQDPGRNNHAMRGSECSEGRSL